MSLGLDQANPGVQLRGEVEVLIAEEGPVVLRRAEGGGVMGAYPCDLGVFAGIEIRNDLFSGWCLGPWYVEER